MISAGVPDALEIETSGGYIFWDPLRALGLQRPESNSEVDCGNLEICVWDPPGSGLPGDPRVFGILESMQSFGAEFREAPQKRLGVLIVPKWGIHRISFKYTWPFLACIWGEVLLEDLHERLMHHLACRTVLCQDLGNSYAGI